MILLAQRFRKLALILSGAIALQAAMVLPIPAVDNTVTFSSLIAGTCILLVDTNGILAPNTDYTALSSESLGGVPGTVSIVTTSGGFDISALAPGAFDSAPATGGDNVTFAADYSGLGTTIIGATDGATTTSLNLGLTILTVDLTATKSTGNFPSGSYAADVIVRCE